MRLTLVRGLVAMALCVGVGGAQSAPAASQPAGSANAATVDLSPPQSVRAVFQPTEFGVVLQGGNGVTDNRDGFHFISAGVHAGRVLTETVGHGVLRGNFEYAVELFPYWQSYTPVFQRVSCTEAPGTTTISCSAPYNVGGKFTGVTLTPIILRWNLERRGKWMPWLQGAGGVLWTNHKYPSYGDLSANLTTNGPNGDASVWNFTPQGGVGVHYFTAPHRSIDVSAMGVHISSASLGDRNPGVNASVQFAIGYTWWK